MSKKSRIAIIVMALAALFQVNAYERNLSVEFTCGSFFGLTDGSVWEMVENEGVRKGDNLSINGNYRREWHKRLRDLSVKMKEYQMKKNGKRQVFHSRLVGVTDRIERAITFVTLPEYDIVMVDLFCQEADDELFHLVELEDGRVFASMSPREGDCAGWREQDKVLVVRFDQKNSFLLNITNNTGCVTIPIGILTSKKEKDKVKFDNEKCVQFEINGAWDRLGSFASFPWQTGEEVTFSIFETVMAGTKPGDGLHLNNKGRYALFYNSNQNEVAIFEKQHIMPKPMPPVKKS